MNPLMNATHATSRRTVRRLALGGILAVLLATVAVLSDRRATPPVAGAADEQPPRMSDDQYTPIIQSVHSTPRWFLGADERVHLVYELLLTNAFPLPATVTTVEVLDGAGGQAIATLAGADLSAAMSLLTSPAEPATTLPPSTVGVVWFDLPFTGPEQLPATIAHRLTVTVMPPGAPPAAIVDVSGWAMVDRRPPVVLSPPLLGPRWFAAGSCCDGPHRRALFPVNGTLHLAQRFAIDFNLLDAEYRLTVGDPRLNASTVGFGQPVIAVVDAMVLTAVDRYPDRTPDDGFVVTLESVGGNHVILDLGDGRFAYYAHLRAGTVAVQAGERVRRGQRLGELGNSGNSTGAHLHFHVMDRPSGQVADGLPYVFDAFQLIGRTPPLAEVIELDQAQQPIPLDTRGAGPRRDALPLGADVVTFWTGP
jgi:hypothetical protein